MLIEFSPAVETTLLQLAEQQGKTAEQIVAQIVIKNLPNESTNETLNSQPSYAKGDFNFDLDSIKASIESGIHPMPKFKNDEEFLAWVNA